MILPKKEKIDLSISSQYTDGYSLTLTTLALKYLDEVQEEYGPRVTEYTYGGVEIAQSTTPLFWFPFDKYVVIRISPQAITNLKEAIFQIAHEVIHILSPTPGPTTTNLEEGLATWFSLKVAERDGEDDENPIAIESLRKYQYPYKLVSELIRLRPDTIAELRKVQPVLGRIKKEDFIKAKLDVPEELIDELVNQMEY